MDKTTFISLLKNPENAGKEHINDIREMSVFYPYFAFPHFLLAKQLKTRQDVNAEQYAQIASLYVADIRWFYYYLYPELIPLSVKQASTPRLPGDYFSMIEMIERQGGDTKTTLRSLAERLKAAQNIVIDDKTKKQPVTVKLQKDGKTGLPNHSAEDKEEISEELVQKQITERKYHEAIETLRQLNLLYPKKSIYFAAQIRFLEKVIENSHK